MASYGELLKHRQRIREMSKYYCVTSYTLDSTSDQIKSAKNESLDASLSVRPPVRLADDNQLTALAQLAALRLNCQRALVSLIDDKCQHIIAEATRFISPFEQDQRIIDDALIWGVQSIPIELTICPLMLEAIASNNDLHFDQPGNRGTKTHVIVTDLATESRTRDIPILKVSPTLRFYLEVPILSTSGYALGSLCVIDDKPRSPSPEDVSCLQDMSKLILQHLDWVRIKVDHGTAERLLEGLSHFNQGKDSISHWSSVTQGQKYIPSLRTESVSLTSSILPRPSHASEVISPRTHAASLTESDIRSQSFSEALSCSEFSGVPIASDLTSMSLCDTGQANDQSDTVADVDLAAEDKNDADDETEAVTSSSASVQHAFARASNLLREGMDIDFACFLEVPHNERFKARRESSNRKKRLVEESHRRSESDSWTDSSADGTSQTSIVQASADETTCRRLGYSTKSKSTLANSKSTSSYLSLPAWLLTALALRYPNGRIFHFNESGCLSSSDDVKRTKHGSSIPRRTLSSRLLNAFPDAKSLIFVPLYDNDKQQIYAGFLGWTTTANRILQPHELLYVSGFTHSIMCEVMRLDALATDKAKSNFISSVSHELRSPLHGILASNQLLSETSAIQPQQLEYMQMIDTCARTLLDIMDHLLDHAKINHFTKQQPNRAGPRRTGNPQYERESFSLLSNVDLLALVEETVASVAASSNQMLGDVVSRASELQPMEAAGHTQAATTRLSPPILIDVEPHASWNFVTEAGSWRRVVMNLLGNSLKYTQKGHISVSLALRNYERKTASFDRVLELRIADTGQGISDEYLKHRLYTPFAQENNLSVGTGLGLSLVKQIVSSLQGDIKIHSELGLGTEVVVEVPLKQVSEPEQQVPKLSIDARQALVTQTTGKSFKFWGFDDQMALRGDSLSTGVPDQHTKALMVIGQSLRTTLERWFHMYDSSAGRTDVHIVENAFLTANKTVFDQTGNNLIVIGTMGRKSTVTTIHKANIQYVLSPIGPARLANALTRLFEVRQTIGISEKPVGVQDVAKSSPTMTRLDPCSMKPPPKSHGSDRDDELSWATVCEAEPSPVSESATATIPPHNKDVILLVDDNDINLRILLTTVTKLKGNDIQCLTAINGQDALDKYTSVIESGVRISMCFMDISMPVMDGYEATKRIRNFEKSRNIRGSQQCIIIALTGLASEEAQHKIQDCGFNVYLRKPVSLSKLRDVLGAGGSQTIDVR